MIVNLYSAKCMGIDAVLVTVEVDISAGIGVHLVGLADAAVKESLLRTVTALQAVGFRIPGLKIVINLAPADVRKKGSGYDLPIAVGIIAASEQTAFPLMDKFIMMGELGLDGTVRTVPGALPVAELAIQQGFKGCIMPRESAKEAAELNGIDIYGVQTLTEVIDILTGKEDCSHLIVKIDPNAPAKPKWDSSGMDFADIIGQDGAKRGLEIAASGGHNVLLIGPPGAGKSSLSRASANILPAMTTEEAIVTSKIYSVSGKGDFQNGGLMRTRPFRTPHYSTSTAALIGGGSDNIIPGEISLAHNGVLFLDEFCEMPKSVVEALRAPLEDRKVVVSRLKTKIEYPADFMLIAATNPCPCGYFGQGNRCVCTAARRAAYLSRLSGPIMDRIDLQLWINPVEATSLVNSKKEESSEEIARRVLRARKIQLLRFAQTGNFTNASMSRAQIEEFCALDELCRSFLEKTISASGLSARAFHRILKLARTIADLELAADASLWSGVDTYIGNSLDNPITIAHLSEAISYRFLDKADVYMVM